MIAVSFLLLSVADLLQRDDLEVFVRSHQDLVVFAFDPHKDEVILDQESLLMGPNPAREAGLSW